MNPAVLKTVIRKYRGFESPSLFQKAVTRDKLVVSLLSSFAVQQPVSVGRSRVFQHKGAKQSGVRVTVRYRRDAREAEWGRLLICCTCMGTRGSNPRLSASK